MEISQKSGVMRMTSDHMTDDEIIDFIKKYDKTDKLTWSDETCIECDSQLNSWDIRISRALLIIPHRCERCIAEMYGMTVDGLRDRMQDEFGMSPCKGI